jgi:hypothetical protein
MKKEEIKTVFTEAMTKISEEDLDWLITNCLSFKEKIAILEQMNTTTKRKIIENLIYEL